MEFVKSTITTIDDAIKTACSCLSCPCNGKATSEGKSSKTEKGADGAQNNESKKQKLNSASGCS